MPTVDIDQALKFYHLYENTHYDTTCPQYLAWGGKKDSNAISLFMFCFENGLKAVWQAGHHKIEEANKVGARKTKQGKEGGRRSLGRVRQRENHGYLKHCVICFPV